MKYSKKKILKCHAIIYKDNINMSIFCITKVHIASMLGISVDTIDRHLDENNIYDTKEWTILCNRDIIPSNRKFNGKRRTLR